MWWPLWIALTSAGMAVTWFTDRTAFVSYLAVLCGLLAMRWAVSMPFFLGPLTVWSVVAAIVISTNQNILAGIFAILIPFPYIFAVFGWPASDAYFWSDVNGVGLLVVLAIPSGLVLVDSWRTSEISYRLGLNCARVEPLDPGALRAWAGNAYSALVRAQESAPPEALERCD